MVIVNDPILVPFNEKTFYFIDFTLNCQAVRTKPLIKLTGSQPPVALVTDPSRIRAAPSHQKNYPLFDE